MKATKLQRCGAPNGSTLEFEFLPPHRLVAGTRAVFEVVQTIPVEFTPGDDGEVWEKEGGLALKRHAEVVCYTSAVEGFLATEVFQVRCSDRSTRWMLDTEVDAQKARRLLATRPASAVAEDDKLAHPLKSGCVARRGGELILLHACPGAGALDTTRGDVVVPKEPSLTPPGAETFLQRRSVKTGPGRRTFYQGLCLGMAHDCQTDETCYELDIGVLFRKSWVCGTQRSVEATFLRLEFTTP